VFPAMRATETLPHVTRVTSVNRFLRGRHTEIRLRWFARNRCGSASAHSKFSREWTSQSAQET